MLNIIRACVDLVVLNNVGKKTTPLTKNNMAFCLEEIECLLPKELKTVKALKSRVLNLLHI